MLIKFLTESFRTLVGIAAWCFLVVGMAIGIICGILINNLAFGGEQTLVVVAGALLGFLSAFVAEVVVIPPFMMLFTIDARVKIIEKQLAEKTSQGN